MLIAELTQIHSILPPPVDATARLTIIGTVTMDVVNATSHSDLSEEETPHASTAQTSPTLVQQSFLIAVLALSVMFGTHPPLGATVTSETLGSL